jgi:hypothetical protein
MLQKWESKWQMAINADKCFVIRAGTKRKTTKQDYTIHNHILEVVEESKYLGVTISKDLTWKGHINNITNKANKTLGFIKRYIHGCTQKVKQHTFTTMALVRVSLLFKYVFGSIVTWLLMILYSMVTLFFERRDRNMIAEIGYGYIFLREIDSSELVINKDILI